ncbi:MAG: hypothetical protein HC769_15760 [Cyanobacteria bacterium CRU_2_1]|nr:hypothetical protein [Cyanobacteria bacterium RU_5_0]NJR60155.1 hypothetical protein [Cyanobacteria bacterium CRU_2_1]
MDGLLGFLITSAIFAVAGTALKGLIRPISWGMFLIAALWMGSEQVLNSQTTSSVETAQSPAPTSAVSPTSTPITPTATTGWQTLAQQLEPAVSSALSNADSPSVTSSPTDGLVVSDPATAPVPASTPSRSPAPIRGLW